MKVFALAFTILPLLALANPIAEPDAEPVADAVADRETLFDREVRGAGLEKRARTCKLTGCDVRYRTGPGTNYPAPGQISGCGKSVSLSCYTTGTPVSGYRYWDRIASGAGQGRYISEYYIDKNCASQLPPCT